MTKIIYIDIGTHFGQEFNSLFGGQWSFYLKVAKRLAGYYLSNRGEKISLIDIVDLNRLRGQIKKVEEDFLFYFVEANSKIISHCNVYNKAHGVFNCALTGESSLNITKLFLANGDTLSQGSSIFANKSNVSTKDVVPTLGVPSKLFFDEFKKYIDTITDDYVVILRLNCEGVEDDVIYAAHEIFKENLVLTMGSLKDVKECKGEAAYEKLENFLRDNSIPFVFFSHSVNSWKKAYSSIKLLLNKYE
jgi:hypothetical protein